MFFFGNLPPRIRFPDREYSSNFYTSLETSFSCSKSDSAVQLKTISEKVYGDIKREPVAMARQRRWTTRNSSREDPARILLDLACECPCGKGMRVTRKKGARERAVVRERRQGVAWGEALEETRRRIDRSGLEWRACESGHQWSREGSFDEPSRPWAKEDGD